MTACCHANPGARPSWQCWKAKTAMVYRQPSPGARPSRPLFVVSEKRPRRPRPRMCRQEDGSFTPPQACVAAHGCKGCPEGRTRAPWSGGVAGDRDPPRTTGPRSEQNLRAQRGPGPDCAAIGISVADASSSPASAKCDSRCNRERALKTGPESHPARRQAPNVTQQRAMPACDQSR